MLNLIYNNQENAFFDLVKKMTRGGTFNNKYQTFINNKTKKNYIALVSFITYTFKNFESGIINLNAFVLYDDKFNVIYYSFLEELNKNVFENYLSKNIFVDNGFTMFKPLQINYQTKGYVLTKPITPPIETTVTPFKKVVYVGYWLEIDTFDSFIEVAHTNGVTHVILEFIVLDGFDLTDIVKADTIGCWCNLSLKEQTDILNKMKGYGMTLMASFGGATSFTNGFQCVLNSLTYADPANLAKELVKICCDNQIYAIDLDIEYFPTTSVYYDTDNLVNYAGVLSQKIKEFGKERIQNIKASDFNPEVNDFIVSHAPQTPYFNSPLFGYVYSNIEKKYGTYIDFYNIQYYNQGDCYTTYKSIFEDDIFFYASVKQLINAPDVNCTDIPPYKIVLGKATEQETDSGFVPLYSTDATVNTMTKFVNKALTAVPEIEWGGIMVWMFQLEVPNINNDNLMQYFGNVPNN